MPQYKSQANVARTHQPNKKSVDLVTWKRDFRRSPCCNGLIPALLHSVGVKQLKPSVPLGSAGFCAGTLSTDTPEEDTVVFVDVDDEEGEEEPRPPRKSSLGRGAGVGSEVRR